MEEITKEKLESLLKEAETAHADYEERLGRRDENWPAWYAEFIVERLGEPKN
jgi:hypothetical protein